MSYRDYHTLTLCKSKTSNNLKIISKSKTFLNLKATGPSNLNELPRHLAVMFFRHVTTF